MFNTCFVCSVVVSGGHKNKRPFFPLSLSQSWNKWDKHNRAKNGRPVLKIEKKKTTTTTAERWQVSERRYTFPDTVSVASKLPTGNQNRSFLWNMCQPLVSHFVSCHTFVYCPVNKGSKLGNSRRKSFSSLSLCHDGSFARHVATCSSPRVKT